VREILRKLVVKENGAIVFHKKATEAQYSEIVESLNRLDKLAGAAYSFHKLLGDVLDCDDVVLLEMFRRVFVNANDGRHGWMVCA
jgi:hypothetical protein